MSQVVYMNPNTFNFRQEPNCCQNMCKKSDELRDKLKKMHIEIEDTPDGTKWFKTN